MANAKRQRQSAPKAPKGCPWSAHETKTALTHPEVWFRDVEVEEVGSYPRIKKLILRRDGRAVELPACWDGWRQMTYPPSFVVPNDVARVLGADGATFTRRRGKQWSVTIPFAWFDF